MYSNQPDSGLTLIYVSAFSLTYFLGAVIYAFPWYHTGKFLDTTIRGFIEVTIALIAFGVGNILVAPLILKLIHPRQNVQNNKLIYSQYYLPKFYFFIGLIFFIVLFPLLGRLPTISAIISVGQYFIVVGICLRCYQAFVIEKNYSAFRNWIILSFLFPFITIINQGFLGYGTIMALIVLIFVGRFYRPRWRVFLAGIIVFYFALTFYQGYIRDREEIRETVWGGQSLVIRMEQLYSTISTTKLFNPYNNEQLERIDLRLNQNYLLGYAVENLELSKDYANGETLKDSLIALVPRIVWPQKPVVAGSGDLVENYTGLKFEKSTSIGIGQVMEFYINFGRLGVIIGFIIIGLIISILDFISGIYLNRGDWRSFTFYFIPGIALLNIGGSFVEITAAAASGIVVTILASLIPKNYYSRFLLIIFLLASLFVIKKFYLPLVVPIFNYILVFIFLIFCLFLLKSFIQVNKK
ncbi:MAG: hypothetical protein ACR2NW_07990 [Thermodesulfobacteriota bacterium]